MIERRESDLKSYEEFRGETERETKLGRAEIQKRPKEQVKKQIEFFFSFRGTHQLRKDDRKDVLHPPHDSKRRGGKRLHCPAGCPDQFGGIVKNEK